MPASPSSSPSSLQAGWITLLRALRGRASREPRCRDTASVGWSHGSPRSRRDPPPAGPHPDARARADPPRPHAAFALRVLPRRGGDHGLRPRRHAGQRPARAAVRRRAPRQLRRIRRARSAASSSTSTTSTRRCRDPGNGTSSAWPRASRSPAASAASAAAARRDAVRGTRAARTARRCAASPRCARSTSGTPASTKSACRSTLQRIPAQGTEQGGRRRPGARTACAHWPS